MGLNEDLGDRENIGNASVQSGATRGEKESELKFIFENLPAMCAELEAARATIQNLRGAMKTIVQQKVDANTWEDWNFDLVGKEPGETPLQAARRLHPNEVFREVKLIPDSGGTGCRGPAGSRRRREGAVK